MDLTVTAYDSEGKEIEIKPGHCFVYGKDGSCCQVPVPEYSAEFVYKAEFGSRFPVKFPKTPEIKDAWTVEI